MHVKAVFSNAWYAAFRDVAESEDGSDCREGRETAFLVLGFWILDYTILRNEIWDKCTPQH